MFNKLMQNTRKPKGVLGKLMLKGMNSGHAKMSDWGFTHLDLQANSHILDIGCGGGANIAKMLSEISGSMVDGLDYSEESVAFSKKTNATHLEKRCKIRQGDVASLPYNDQSLDCVTAFETIYFWPDLNKAFTEIKRVLKANGTFFILCDSDNVDDTTWTNHIDGMTIYSGEDLKSRLKSIGFKTIKIHKNKKGWICLTAIS